MSKTEDFFQQVKDKINKKNEELRKLARPKEELYTTITCNVEKVEWSASSTYITPISEARIGGTSSRYYGGTSCKTVISVDHNTVRRIIVPGNAPFEKGDEVLVKLDISEEKYDEPCPFDYNIIRKPFYIERSLKEEEAAIKISKIKNSEIVAEYNVR